jgi:LCP family protein required for cell wall assembly
VLTCFFFTALGAVFGNVYWTNKDVRELLRDHAFSTVVNVVTGQGATADWNVEKQFPSSTTSMNVLILGVDFDYDNYGRIVKTTHGRSDSIMVAHVDFLGKTINALTIPRDTAVNIDGYRGIHKINAAHSFGGPEKTMETIKNVFGIDTDAYVTINFHGFRKLVDALGGVDIDVEKKLDYDDNWGNLHIHLKPGMQHMDGYQAMGYVRMRHSDSDEMRSKRQHNFLEAVRSKLKSPTMFGAMPHVVSSLSYAIKRGRLTQDQMLSLAFFAKSLPKDNISIKTLPSFEGPSYVTIDVAKSEQLIQQMFFPGTAVSVIVNAPSSSVVASMNSRYGPGGKHGKKGDEEETTKPDKPVLTPRTDLTVEDPPPGKSTGDAGGVVEPPPLPGDKKDGDSGDGKVDGTGKGTAEGNG